MNENGMMIMMTHHHHHHNHHNNNKERQEKLQNWQLRNTLFHYAVKKQSLTDFQKKINGLLSKYPSLSLWLQNLLQNLYFWVEILSIICEFENNFLVGFVGKLEVCCFAEVEESWELCCCCCCCRCRGDLQLCCCRGIEKLEQKSCS